MTKSTHTDNSTTKDSPKTMTLGEFLGDMRRIRRHSLREIEEATGKSVSNAYLSQLEKGHIKKPSPNILYSLANVYSVPYETLMQKAGYIADDALENNSRQQGNRMAAFVDETLTKEEEEALLEYLAFLRSKK